MRNSKILVVVLSVVMFAFSASNISAQKKGECCSKQKMEQKKDCSKIIPDLTDDQQVKIEKLRVDHMAAVAPLKEKLKVNREAHRNLMSADKIDQKAIDANIDEHAKIKADMMKLQSKHMATVKGLLNDVQKKAFDAHHAKNGMGCAKVADCSKGKQKGMQRACCDKK